MRFLHHLTEESRSFAALALQLHTKKHKSKKKNLKYWKKLGEPKLSYVSVKTKGAAKADW